MKQIEFKTSKGEFMVFDMTGIDYDILGINDQKLKKISSILDITEEQATKVVEGQSDSYGRIYMFWDYNTINHPFNPLTFDNALESLHSLLKANGVVFENPLGNEPQKKDFYKNYVYMLGDHCRANVDWREAQRKVWNKQQTYLFKKI